ncbi:MAG: S41 family peptidase [Patescibacteria group bacterium]|nr:S41 family peptidase [Patescibacteria group bacterium]
MDHQQEKKQFKVYFMVAALATFFILGVFFGKRSVADREFSGVTKNGERFSVEGMDFLNEVWEKVNGKYVGETPDSQEALEGAAKGLVSSLGDPYTVFWDEEESQDFLGDMEGSFEGIGAEVGIRKQMLTVISPLDEMPAQQAGLKAGDIILQINGEITTEMTLDEAVKKIRGPRGTQVKLVVVRGNNGDGKPLEFEITRDKIDFKSASWEEKDDQIAYVRVSGFLRDTDQEFSEVAKEIKNKNIKKIVLDLRNNPGGYLEMAVSLSSYFLPKGSLVVTEDYGDANKSKNEEHYTENRLNKASLEEYPLVILINEGTASSAEILAGAVRDGRGVSLIGKKTFGKGSVQEVEKLSNGSSVKITVAKWLTPKGVNLEDGGLEPDIEQEIFIDSAENEEDQQLLKAIEVVKEL